MEESTPPLIATAIFMGLVVWFMVSLRWGARAGALGNHGAAPQNPDGAPQNQGRHGGLPLPPIIPPRWVEGTIRNGGARNG
ncbi:hypothetical protein GURASL_10590 [Geotalea uraniireducens]|uniref:Secreted protein n=1 Tax=Geotalea uraniireducens TaxID=351604 RepID=A0ABM8EI76_9BACT|nr:hypothetical protein GURASL_10590 [Geotalea uraniireducens]